MKNRSASIKAKMLNLAKNEDIDFQSVKCFGQYVL